MQRKKLIAAAIALTGLVVTEAMARPNYPSRIPTPFSCSTCHIAVGGGGPRNPFGVDFPNNGHTWAGVCQLDSDMDGVSNGAELGDPDCVWMPGDPMPDFAATRPGDPMDTPPPPQPEPEPQPEPMPEGEPEPQPEPMPEGEPAPQPEPMPEGEPAPQPEPMPEGEPAPQPEPMPEGEPAPQPEPMPEAPAGDAGVDTDGGAGGEGGEGSASDDDDGGCDASGGTSAAPLFGLAILLGLRRRRRRG